MAEARASNVINFKELDTYLALNTAVAQFFAKEKRMIKRLLWRHHWIEDLSYLDGIDEEPTFSSIDDDEEEEVAQKEPPK